MQGPNADRLITFKCDIYLVFFSKTDDNMWLHCAADNINQWLHLAVGAIQIIRDTLRGEGGLLDSVTKRHRGEGGQTKYHVSFFLSIFNLISPQKSLKIYVFCKFEIVTSHTEGGVGSESMSPNDTGRRGGHK